MVPTRHPRRPDAAAAGRRAEAAEGRGEDDGVHGVFPAGEPDETDEQRAAPAFDAMDVDGDGELSAEEIFRTLSTIIRRDPRPRIAVADKNGTGRVERNI